MDDLTLCPCCAEQYADAGADPSSITPAGEEGCDVCDGPGLGPLLLPTEARVRLTLEDAHARWLGAVCALGAAEDSPFGELPGWLLLLLEDPHTTEVVVGADEVGQVLRVVAQVPGWTEGTVRPLSVDWPAPDPMVEGVRVRRVATGRPGTVLQEDRGWMTILWDGSQVGPHRRLDDPVGRGLVEVL